MRRQLFLSAITCVIYIIVARYNQADWDLWARFAVGAIFFQTGTVLKHDIFAYTPTKDIWIDHEWGSGVIFYFLSHYFGNFGLLYLKFLIIFGIFLLVFSINQHRSDERSPYRIVYYLLFFFGLLVAFDNTIRSHSFTYLFFALWLYVLDLVRLGNTRLIWIFPATMLIWANVHGGFLAGLGILFVYGIGELINRRSYIKYFIAFVLSMLATLINPYGFKYWTFLIDAVTMPRPFVTEWAPIDLFGPVTHVLGFKIFVILVLLSLPYLFIKRFKEINWAEILILVVTFYAAIRHARHCVFFIIASASYIYYYLYPAIDWYTWGIIDKFYSIFPDIIRKTGKYLRESLIYGPILILGILTVLLVPLEVKVNEQMFPARAVKFIQENKLSGNLLVLFNWGSYALWKLYPQCLIPIDGRYEEVYPEEVVNDVARFHYVGVNWDGLLTKYHTDVILVPLIYKDLYSRLLSLRDWKLAYKDDVAAVFVPKSKNRDSWKIPDKNFDPGKEMYVSNIKF